MRNLKFTTQLIIGFSIILFFGLLFAGYSIFQIKRIQSDTELLYLHPYTVSNKVRDIQINVNTIHSLMRNAELALNEKDLDDYRKAISEYDSLIQLDFQLINERFLGDKSIVDQVYNEYTKWTKFRNETIELIYKSKEPGSVKLAEEQCAVQLNILFSKARQLSDFAENKAIELYQSTEKKQRGSVLIIIFLALILSGLLIAFTYVFIKNISSPIRGFIAQIDGVLKKKDLSNNKIKDLSESDLLLKAVFELKSAYAKLEGFNSKLEEQVKIRTNELVRSKEMAEENERKFKTIFNEAPNGIALVDSNTGFFYEANPMFAKIIGRTIEETKNIDWMTITHPDDIKKDIDKMTLLNSGKINAYQMEKRYIKPDGAIVWINLTVAALNLADLESMQHLAMIEDITERKNAEDEIRKLSRAVEQSPVTVIITDINGDIEYVNPKFTETTGYSFEEVIGKNPRILKSGETSSEIYEKLWETVISGNEWKGELHNKNKNGKLYWELASISPIRNTDGKTTHFLGVKEDITKRKQAEEELRESGEKYRLLAENIKDVIWIYNVTKSKFTYMSPSILAMRGYTTEEDIKMGIAERLTPDSANKAQQVIDASLKEFLANPNQKRQYYNEFQEMAKDGSIYWIETISQPQLAKNGDVEILGVSRNIQKRKQAELALKDNEINLQKLNATKDKFFSIIAHDLKTPFNSIMGFSDLLSEQIQEKDYEGVEKYVQIIQQSSHSAMDLLLNLMEWSRTQTNRLDFTPEYVELVKLMNEVAELLRGSAIQKTITISLNLPRNAVVFADKSMISTVCRNLISNAIKFTPQGGKIDISVQQQQNELWVSIKDSGVGIDKSDIDKLFRIDGKFSKPGTQNEKGTGLGLILCKEFVEKHNGEIWVESDKGKGSTFYFSIPNH